MCTYLFAYCVDIELPSNFLNHDAAREQEWTNKLVRNVIILVSYPDVHVDNQSNFFFTTRVWLERLHT